MAIIDPRHSRPIDVHRWSDHPEVNDIVDAVWREHLHDFRANQSGPKPKTRFKDQLKVLILDLYVAWATDPDLSIGVPMSVGAWNTSSRYNALHISKVIIPIVHKLDEVGLIDLARGSYSGPGAASNRNTRIRASQLLQGMFAKARFELEDIFHSPHRETIILRNDDGPEGRSRPIEYEDTEDTIRMRADLQAYNALLARTFIDIRDLEQPFIERRTTSGPRTGTIQRIPIGPSNTFVRRVFSRGRWDLNGRFYGGWWQQIDKTRRNLICINRTPTVEIDFRGLHVAILSKERGVPLTADPYHVETGVIDGFGERDQRGILKQLVLTALNARSLKSAFKAFRDGYPAGSREKSLRDADLKRLLDVFVRRHPHLEDALGADQGIRLMYKDSVIAEQIINHFTQREIPVLCIHDSFIIDHRRSMELKSMMEEVTSGILGGTLATSQDFAGIDHFMSNPENKLEWYLQHRAFPPYSKGFNHRWERFQERRRILDDNQSPEAETEPSL